MAHVMIIISFEGSGNFDKNSADVNDDDDDGTLVKSYSMSQSNDYFVHDDYS